MICHTPEELLLATSVISLIYLLMGFIIGRCTVRHVESSAATENTASKVER